MWRVWIVHFGRAPSLIPLRLTCVRTSQMALDFLLKSIPDLFVFICALPSYETLSLNTVKSWNVRLPGGIPEAFGSTTRRLPRQKFDLYMNANSRPGYTNLLRNAGERCLSRGAEIHVKMHAPTLYPFCIPRKPFICYFFLKLERRSRCNACLDYYFITLLSNCTFDSFICNFVYW